MASDDEMIMENEWEWIWKGGGGEVGYNFRKIILYLFRISFYTGNFMIHLLLQSDIRDIYSEGVLLSLRGLR
jgi:hypothetical protein